MRFYSGMVVLLSLLLTGCVDESAKVNAKDSGEPSSYERERVTAKHVGYYVGSDAKKTCDILGKTNESRYNYNINNSYSFNVNSSDTITRAELVCTHRYTKRVGMYTQSDRNIETRPVVYVLSKKYNEENRHLSSLGLIEKEILSDH